MPQKDKPSPQQLAIMAMYQVLALLGVVKKSSEVKTRFTYKKTDNISLAIPGIKYGVAFQGDSYKKLEEDGWRIEHIATEDLLPFHRVFSSLDASRIAYVYANADPNKKTTSAPEDRLLDEIISRMLPIPDRNYTFKRDNGTELTTPDFTWEDHKIAFFMDGAYWHSVKDDQAIIKQIKKSKNFGKYITDSRKDKVRKDGAIRSELGALGWIVLSCTDDDIATDEGLSDVVDNIERAIKNVEASKSVSLRGESQDQDFLDDLLSGSADDSSPVEEEEDRGQDNRTENGEKKESNSTEPSSQSEKEDSHNNVENDNNKVWESSEIETGSWFSAGDNEEEWLPKNNGKDLKEEDKTEDSSLSNEKKPKEKESDNYFAENIDDILGL